MSSLENPPQFNPESLSDEEKEVAARIKKSFESSESITDFLKYRNLKEKAYFGRLNEEELDELLALDFEEELDANPPIRGVFSPENELKKIKRLPKSEKGSALYEFKEKLNKQREALASLRNFIERRIELNNDVPRGKLIDLVEMFAEEYGFNNDQIEKIEEIIDSYYFYRKNALDLRARFPRDLDLIQELSGVRLPDDSDIEVGVGPMSIDISVDAINAQVIYSGGREENKTISTEDYGFMNESSHKNKVFYIVINKDKPDALTLVHEREHVKNVIFHDIFDKKVGFAIDKEFEKQYKRTADANLKRTILESYFRLKMDQALQRAKDEILAIEKEGRDDDENYQKLFSEHDDEYSYDYLAAIRDRASKKNDALWAELSEKILVKEYGEIINKALVAFDELEAGGYTRDGAIALLGDEPMARWPKVAKRLLEYQKNKKF